MNLPKYTAVQISEIIDRITTLRVRWIRHVETQLESEESGPVLYDYKFGAEPADMACDLCDDTGWVCEDHADRPLKGDSKCADACSFGAGMPCPRCRRDSRHVDLVPRLPSDMHVVRVRKCGSQH
jgi:hypothetical protein